MAASSSWNSLEIELCFSSAIFGSVSSFSIWFSFSPDDIGCVTVASELLTELESSSARTELNSWPQMYDRSYNIKILIVLLSN